MTVNCKICGKQFDSFRGLNGHMNAHLKRRTFHSEEIDDEDYWEPYLEALEVLWWHCVEYVDYASETYVGIVECINLWTNVAEHSSAHDVEYIVNKVHKFKLEAIRYIWDDDPNYVWEKLESETRELLENFNPEGRDYEGSHIPTMYSGWPSLNDIKEDFNPRWLPERETAYAFDLYDAEEYTKRTGKKVTRGRKQRWIPVAIEYLRKHGKSSAAEIHPSLPDHRSAATPIHAMALSNRLIRMPDIFIVDKSSKPYKYTLVESKEAETFEGERWEHQPFFQRIMCVKPYESIRVVAKGVNEKDGKLIESLHNAKTFKAEAESVLPKQKDICVVCRGKFSWNKEKCLDCGSGANLWSFDAESFSADTSLSELTVHVEVPDKANTKSITLEIPTNLIDDEYLIHEAIEDKLMEILGQPFGGWDLISIKELDAESFGAEGFKYSYYKRNKAEKQWGINKDKLWETPLWNKTINLLMKYERQGLTQGDAFDKAAKETGMWDAIMKGIERGALREAHRRFYDPNNNKYNSHMRDFDAESFAATGVCNCGSSCNCDCGCAESGVCNCGPSCPCNCGCGIGAESFEAEEPFIVRGTWRGGVVEFSNGDVFVKVITFPVTDDSGFSGESMWVILEEGNEFEGIGILDNDPVHSEIKSGSRIKFTGGNTHYKPHFVAVVESESFEANYNPTQARDGKGRWTDTESNEVTIDLDIDELSALADAIRQQDETFPDVDMLLEQIGNTSENRELVFQEMLEVLSGFISEVMDKPRVESPEEYYKYILEEPAEDAMGRLYRQANYYAQFKNSAEIEKSLEELHYQYQMAKELDADVNILESIEKDINFIELVSRVQDMQREYQADWNPKQPRMPPSKPCPTCKKPGKGDKPGPPGPPGPPGKPGDEPCPTCKKPGKPGKPGKGGKGGKGGFNILPPMPTPDQVIDRWVNRQTGDIHRGKKPKGEQWRAVEMVPIVIKGKQYHIANILEEIVKMWAPSSVIYRRNPPLIVIADKKINIKGLNIKGIKIDGNNITYE